MTFGFDHGDLLVELAAAKTAIDGLAGTGTLGAGTVSELSAGNVSGDGTDLGSGQGLDLETID